MRVTLWDRASDAMCWHDAQGSRSTRGTSRSWCGPARRPSAAVPRCATSAPCSPCSWSATTAPRATCPAGTRPTCCRRLRLRRTAAVIKASAAARGSSLTSGGRRPRLASAAAPCNGVHSLGLDGSLRPWRRLPAQGRAWAIPVQLHGANSDCARCPAWKPAAATQSCRSLMGASAGVDSGRSRLRSQSTTNSKEHALAVLWHERMSTTQMPRCRN